MLKKLKRKLKAAKNNHGSSFVLVIVSATFLSILVSALLMGMLLAYKLRYYKINSLNNFYSVEKAMDEIYAGVGASANEHLYSAYTTTAELVVYYKDGKYANLSTDEANELFKKFFMQGLMDDDRFKDMSTLVETLESYISDSNVKLVCDNLKVVYKDSNNKCRYVQYGWNEYTNKVQENKWNDPDFAEEDVEEIAIKNLGVRRTIELTTTKDKETMAPGTYVQTITTDLVLKKPDYNVAFDASSATTGDSLYNYALLADMGLEIDGTQTTSGDVNVNIKGNIYTASDYYNKDYNGTTTTKVTNKYSSSVSRNWGAVDESAYSGIFVRGSNAELSMNSDIVINSGSLAAFDGANINLSGRSTLLSELWTDNIIIGGTVNSSSGGSEVILAADAYVYDDTELNANNASLKFTSGRYFGYSYKADDMRSINLLKTQLPTNFSLKSHFNDSAIIVNGQNSVLDMSNLDSLYIAGKSYIEFSKVAASTVSDDDKVALGLVETESDGTLKKDADGNYVTKDVDYAFTTLEDYSTGQSLDVKSNQLIFLAQWEVVDGSETTGDDGFTYVTIKFPSAYANNSQITGLYNKLKTLIEESNEKTGNTSSADTSSGGSWTAIKETVSGHDYYYLYIPDEKIAQEFAEAYYKLMDNATDDTSNRLYNVTNYEDFSVKLFLPSDSDSVSAQAAVTAQEKKTDTLYIKADTGDMSGVDESKVETALKNVTQNKTFSLLLGNNGVTQNNLAYEDLKTQAANLADTTASTTTAEEISDLLSYMYINLKDHLSILDEDTTVESTIETTETDGTTTTSTTTTTEALSAWDIVGYTKNSDGKYSSDATTTDKGSMLNYTEKDGETYDYNYSVTPLTNYVDFDYVLNEMSADINETVTVNGTQAKVVVSKGDITVTASEANSDMYGIIVAAGDVTFEANVKSFTGLIVAGGKVICNHSINIKADATFVSTLLGVCADTPKSDTSNLYLLVYGDTVGSVQRPILKGYEVSTGENSTTVSESTLSDISYSDILGFQNWKKNVE